MPHKITYYAVVGGGRTVSDPYGLVRRLEHDDGPEDEGLRRDFSWKFTPAIAEWKHGDFSYELVEVSHAQASEIIEYFRGKWGPFGQPATR
ncbi:MAG TPA: hypothetical protein VGG16_03730 [Streptosporangiaceae bacterium]